MPVEVPRADSNTPPAPLPSLAPTHQRRHVRGGRGRRAAAASPRSSNPVQRVKPPPQVVVVPLLCSVSPADRAAQVSQAAHGASTCGVAGRGAPPTLHYYYSRPSALIPLAAHRGAQSGSRCSLPVSQSPSPRTHTPGSAEELWPRCESSGAAEQRPWGRTVTQRGAFTDSARARTPQPRSTCGTTLSSCINTDTKLSHNVNIKEKNDDKHN